MIGNKMKRMSLVCLAAVSGFSGVAFAADKADRQESVKVEYTFDTEEELTDWLVEGEGRIYIENGEMILEPLYYPLMEALMKAGVVSDRNVMKEYYPYLYPAMKAKYGNDVRNYFLIGKGEKVFMGGPFNLWNKRVSTTQDFAIEFDFRALSPAPLHMLMFCASGMGGESVFDPSLPPRYGVENETIHEMKMYRVSFFNKGRGTANLRRGPGKVMVAKGKDFVSEDLNKTYHCRVERIGAEVRFFVDGKECFSYTDAEPLSGTEWGFRVMVCGKGAYDNIRVIEIK